MLLDNGARNSVGRRGAESLEELPDRERRKVLPKSETKRRIVNCRKGGIQGRDAGDAKKKNLAGSPT